jgi:hypothetical protein
VFKSKVPPSAINACVAVPPVFIKPLYETNGFNDNVSSFVTVKLFEIKPTLFVFMILKHSGFTRKFVVPKTPSSFDKKSKIQLLPLLDVLK